MTGLRTKPMDEATNRTPAAAAPISSTLLRRSFRRQLLIGALALAMVVLAALALLMQVRLNEDVESRYRQALSIAQQALDAHRLASVSASVSALATRGSGAPGSSASHGTGAGRTTRSTTAARYASFNALLTAP